MEQSGADCITFATGGIEGTKGKGEEQRRGTHYVDAPHTLLQHAQVMKRTLAVVLARRDINMWVLGLSSVVVSLMTHSQVTPVMHYNSNKLQLPNHLRVSFGNKAGPIKRQGVSVPYFSPNRAQPGLEKQLTDFPVHWDALTHWPRIEATKPRMLASRLRMDAAACSASRQVEHTNKAAAWPHELRGDAPFGRMGMHEIREDAVCEGRQDTQI